MGNTNLPQAGAADTENSKDTLNGEEQLTDHEQSRAGKQEEGGVGPSPSHPKNAPARIPGQLRDPENVDDMDGLHHEKRDPKGNVEQPAEDDPHNPENTTGAGDPPPS